MRTGSHNPSKPVTVTFLIKGPGWIVEAETNKHTLSSILVTLNEKKIRYKTVGTVIMLEAK